MKWREEKRKQIMNYVKGHTEYILSLLYKNENKTVSFKFNIVDVPRIGMKYIAMKYNLNTKIVKFEFPEYESYGYKYELVISKK